MYLFDDDGETLFEVDDADCDFCDGGFYLLTENGEDEEFYELTEVSEEDFDFEGDDA